jgi:uncharacterized protein YegJ (DUF2314 family)
MRVVSYFASVFLALFLTSALGADTAVDRAKKDEIVSVPKGDPDMEAAFRQARETLKGFLELARAPRSSITSMAVKVAIYDRGETEYFWISPFKEKDGGFVGAIDNRPRSVRNVKLARRSRSRRATSSTGSTVKTARCSATIPPARCSSRCRRQNAKRSRESTD